MIAFDRFGRHVASSVEGIPRLIALRAALLSSHGGEPRIGSAANH
jgi:hypothetical protein